MSVFPKAIRAAAFAAACIFVLTVTISAHAAEVIHRYASAIELLRDGSVHVTETIDVRAEGINIRRGIYRDIPTVLVNEDGSNLRSRLEVLEITRDGEPEPWFTESIQNGTRIYIGDADIFLTTGDYRYEITYTMSRMARRFEDYDELFWNATGTYWDFPIMESVASVTLPEGAVIANATGYTGAFGSTEQAVAFTRETDNRMIFRATRALNPYEGMSVAVSFQKGVLDELDQTTRALNWLSDYRHVWMPGAAALLIFGYYMLFWSRVGRDPEKGTIIPLFYPPDGFSPGLTHYVWAMGWKNNGWQAFTAAIISLAVKGVLDISQASKKKTTIKVIADADEIGAELSPGEQSVYSYFNARDGVTINKTTGPGLATRKSEFINIIGSENRHVFFRNNTGYTVVGFLLSFAMLLALTFSGVLSIEWLIIAVIGGVAVSLIVGLFRQMMSGSGALRMFQLVIGGFLLVNFGSGLFRTVDAMPSIGIDNAAIAAGTIIATNLIFAFLMRAPTLQGRAIMDKIDGFRMYLETAEKERLNYRGEPDMTVKRFEAILPYAVALGVEKPWTEHFEGELSRNAVSDISRDYQPNWYHSTSFSPSTIGRDMASLATGMSAAMIASQPSTSSSSGSSGGGSSGGGGGGGGGGGW